MVGGGEVARRKINHLLEAGARLTVVAPRVHERIQHWAAEGRLELIAEPYHARLMKAGLRLAYACTADARVNARVIADARKRGVLCNSADEPAAGDFHVPSMVRRGSLLLSISTGGRAPALSREICHRLEQQFGPAWGDFTDLLGDLRDEWKSQGEADRIHRRMLEILASDAFEVLQSEGPAAARARIADLLDIEFPVKNANRPKMSKRSRRSA